MTLNHLCAGCRKSRGRCVAKYVWNKELKRHEQVCTGYKPRLRILLFALLSSIGAWLAGLCELARKGASR